jgi:hypothetical protein
VVGYRIAFIVVIGQGVLLFSVRSQKGLYLHHKAYVWLGALGIILAPARPSKAS